MEFIYFTSYPHHREMVSILIMRTKVFCILLYLLNISIIWVLFSYRVMLLSFSSFVIFYACFIINNIHFIFIRCILFVNLLFVVCLCKDLRVDRMYLLTVWTCYNFSFSRYLPRFMDLRVDIMYLLTVWTCYNFSFSRYLPRFMWFTSWYNVSIDRLNML